MKSFTQKLTLRFLFVLAALAFLAFSSENESSLVQISGEIRPVEWNSDHEVLTIAIVRPLENADDDEIDEEEFVIENDEIGGKLFSEIGSRIDASGEIYLDVDGEKVIRIKSYTLNGER